MRLTRITAADCVCVCNGGHFSLAEMRNSPQGRGGKESRKRKCVGKKGVRGTTAMLAERGGGDASFLG